MMLNQDGAGQAAADLVERELAYLRKYCEGIAELDAGVGSLAEFAESVVQRYSAVPSKEMMLKAHKMSRGEMDHLGRADVRFPTLLTNEPALQESSPKPRRGTK